MAVSPTRTVCCIVLLLVTLVSDIKALICYSASCFTEFLKGISTVTRHTPLCLQYH